MTPRAPLGSLSRGLCRRVSTVWARCRRTRTSRSWPSSASSSRLSQRSPARWTTPYASIATKPRPSGFRGSNLVTAVVRLRAGRRRPASPVVPSWFQLIPIEASYDDERENLSRGKTLRYLAWIVLRRRLVGFVISRPRVQVRPPAPCRIVTLPRPESIHVRVVGKARLRLPGAVEDGDLAPVEAQVHRAIHRPSGSAASCCPCSTPGDSRWNVTCIRNTPGKA